MVAKRCDTVASLATYIGVLLRAWQQLIFYSYIDAGKKAGEEDVSGLSKLSWLTPHSVGVLGLGVLACLVTGLAHLPTTYCVWPLPSSIGGEHVSLSAVGEDKKRDRTDRNDDVGNFGGTSNPAWRVYGCALVVCVAVTRPQ